ncbi:GNAT family N-acetyltransferase [Pinibacter aurantiacus]|uniref:GNAT family N-acetyltransferase n=1 Tax=Pinibacter aurantiacus TaxID=2851599 RepID=A0A9E2S565_9BACT|nr:GNAT family N-acetyltransferase [Pinibacter aurantiacus]MBV4355827.1 GNAT family N-acetyltransferase [Pinibacter aurantiacus]
MQYRMANKADGEALKTLALKAWSGFENELSPENWARLKGNLQNIKTYEDLLAKGPGFVCLNNDDNIVGMSFLVPSGEATELFDESWCSIRFVTVDPDYTGMGIGKTLTQKCIDAARLNGEKTIALHTSEIMHAARHIYESLGFQILKEIEPRLGKRYWVYLLTL